MITAAQCNEAAELLSEREELAEPLARILASKKVRIEYESPMSMSWLAGPEMPMTASFRKMLTDGITEQLAAIDAKLRALGVEPPPAGPAP